MSNSTFDQSTLKAFTQSTLKARNKGGAALSSIRVYQHYLGNSPDSTLVEPYPTVANQIDDVQICYGLNLALANKESIELVFIRGDLPSDTAAVLAQFPNLRRVHAFYSLLPGYPDATYPNPAWEFLASLTGVGGIERVDFPGNYATITQFAITSSLYQLGADPLTVGVSGSVGSGSYIMLQGGTMLAQHLSSTQTPTIRPFWMKSGIYSCGGLRPVNTTTSASTLQFLKNLYLVP